MSKPVFNKFKPTAQMLGRWQPWHKGHMELFKRIYDDVGQVIIMIRTVPSDEEANPRLGDQSDNPFTVDEVYDNILKELHQEGFDHGFEYIIMRVPNIVDIAYGRGVGYTFTEHDLGKDIHDISATKIRQQLREEGKLSK